VGAALYARAAIESEQTAPEILLRAVKAMPVSKTPAFRPNPGNHALYERLYDQYLILHEFLGRRSSQLMHDLAKLRALARKG
jgi:L-ribulokinase